MSQIRLFFVSLENLLPLWWSSKHNKRCKNPDVKIICSQTRVTTLDLENQTLLEAESLHDWPFWLLNISAWFFSALVCHVVLAFLRGLRSVMRSLELSQVAWTSINLLDTLSTLSWTPEKTFLQTRSFLSSSQKKQKRILMMRFVSLSLFRDNFSFCISRSKLKFKRDDDRVTLIRIVFWVP